MQLERSCFGTGHQSASRSTGHTASSSSDAGNGKLMVVVLVLVVMVMVVVLMVVWYRGADGGSSGGDSTWSYILLEFLTKMAIR